MEKFSRQLLDWYGKNARVLAWRVSPQDRARGILPEPYHVWLSEIMLQQTVAATVEDYFTRFVTLWPTVNDLARAESELVMREWAGLGYYARARNLHRTAKLVSESGGFPRDLKGLRELPGIGPYTAAAVAAIAFEERSVVIDGNVNRIMVRHASIEEPIKQAEKAIHAAATERLPNANYGNYAQALMDLGATICRPKNPQCALCPVSDGCLAFQNDKQNTLPTPPVKKSRPVRYGHVYVLRNKSGSIAYEKRPETGLLGGLWALPTSAWQEEAPATNYPIKGEWSEIGEIRHVFTHFELNLKVHITKTEQSAPNTTLFNRNELPLDALPSLFRKALVLVDTQDMS